MRIGCLFGTFDPPHLAHVAVAEHMLLTPGLDEVWLVVTPQNPFKMGRSLSPDRDRLAMVELAVEGHPGLVASAFELDLPRPNYTADTLRRMRMKWPEHAFDLIIGGDNLAAFHRWKDPEEILEHHRVLVYPREGAPMDPAEVHYLDHPRVMIVQDAPFLPGSATELRADFEAGATMEHNVAPAVLEYIKQHRLYGAR